MSFFKRLQKNPGDNTSQSAPDSNNSSNYFKKTKPAIIVTAGFFVIFAMASAGAGKQNLQKVEDSTNPAQQLHTSSSNQEKSENISESNEASESTNNSEQANPANQKSADQTITTQSNSLHINVSSTQSSSSSGGETNDQNVGSEVVINGQPVEIPRNGRIRERIKQETDNLELETDVDLDIDIEGEGDFSITLNN